MSSTGVQAKGQVQSRSAASWLTSSAGRSCLLGLVLIVATVAVYYPVNAHPFVNYDDGIYVTGNLHVRSGFSWDTVRWAFTTYDVGTWHPLAWLSHALDCQLFGLDPAGHHDVSLVLHIANVLLLFWVLLQATGYVGRSFMVAALFGLHPINVESVAWIAERKNLLSMLFFLLALGAYRWYAREPKIGRYAAVAFLYALGLMSKPQVITFPCVLLLWDYWPLRRMFAASPEAFPGRTAGVEEIPAQKLSWLILEKLPLFALSGVSAFFTMRAQRAGADKIWYPLSVRVETAIVSYVQYLGKAIWPSRLAVFYPHPGNSLPAWQVYGAMFFLLAVTAFVIERRRPRYLAVGWLWFLGTMVPMIGLEGVGYQGMQGMADRYAYLPFLGLFIMVCWGVADWAEQKQLSVWWLAFPAALILATLMVASRKQLDYWSNNITLWTHALQVTNNNWLAENNVGKELMRQGRTQEGVAHFYAAAAIYPGDPVSNLNIGIYQQQQGNLPEAIERYKTAISGSRDPEVKAVAFNNLGRAYRETGDYSNARQSFAAAVTLNPRNASAWIGLGVAAQRTGDLDLAAKAYSNAMKIQPSDVGYLLLARALEQAGRKDQAQEATQQAKRLSDDFAETQRAADRLSAR